MADIAIDIPKEQLRDFCRRWKITEFGLFGSVVRPDFRPEGSDLDVLVTFARDAHWTLLHMVDMKDELEALFARPVDLLTRNGVERSANRFRRDAILESAVVLDVA
jgi:predicted nucleotidyltransferase